MSVHLIFKNALFYFCFHFHRAAASAGRSGHRHVSVEAREAEVAETARQEQRGVALGRQPLPLPGSTTRTLDKMPRDEYLRAEIAAGTAEN